MKLNVGIIDYGMGNLHSVAKAVALQGGRVTVSSSRTAFRNADLLVLPGVGAFGAAMRNLGRARLDDFVCRWIDEGKPYLGICLGFQILFDRSEESRGVRGLGVFKGSVVKFRGPDFSAGGLPIPHMGWNNLKIKNEAAASTFEGLPVSERYYFVHSFYPVPEDSFVIGTVTDYGKPFCSSLATESVFASQFHPEKSGASGLRLLKNIVKRVSSPRLRRAA